MRYTKVIWKYSVSSLTPMHIDISALYAWLHNYDILREYLNAYSLTEVERPSTQVESFGLWGSKIYRSQC